MSRKKNKEAQVKPGGMSKYALKLQWRRRHCGGAPLPATDLSYNAGSAVAEFNVPTDKK